MSHDQRDLMVTYLRNVNFFEVIFVDFRLMKNIIFNKTERFVGRNTSNHACQNFIFYSKSNCETILIFPPRDNRGQNNKQSECLLRPQLFMPTIPV